MHPAHAWRSLQVGDGAGQAQGAGPAARAQAPGLGGAGQQGAGGGVERDDPLQPFPLGAGVDRGGRLAGLGGAVRLDLARGGDAGGDLGGPLRRRRQGRSAAVTGGTSTVRSMRSSRGPDTRLWYDTWHRGALPQWPRPGPPMPHRQGFCAAISWTLAG